MKNINLSNIKINGSNIEIELLYKNTSISKDTCIFLEDNNSKRYNFIVNKCKNKIIFSYNSDEKVEIAKVMLNIPITLYGKMKIKLEDENGIRDLQIIDNRNQKITENENPYIIFTKKYKIKISEQGIEITEKKCGDKFRYELNKQIYGLKKYKKLFLYRLCKTRKPKYYLFNDRLLYGDDNAEELFLYINKNHPKLAKKCYFVLDKKSTHISRIKKIGKVLKYGSFRHKIKFINCRIVMSSHSSYLGNCFNPFGKEEMQIYKDIINKKFVFLQHGVIMNDVREYLNRELSIADLFITSSNTEFEYVSSEDFMYEHNMVIKTGLPRFDKLRNEIKKVILISPTWRNLGENIKFEESEYFTKYKNLLVNKKLKELLQKNNYKIKFLLHPVFAEHKNLFDEFANEDIEILESNKIRYFELFNECSIFITDYSSIHYDVATLKKPIIYYQFDKKFFFSNHYKSGYFDYEKDGFGKVLENEEQIVEQIEYYLNNKCKIDKQYKDKIENTFAYLDNNNCQRVYDEIVKLDNNQDINYRFNDVH